jgi:hypothetical protein
MSLQKKDGGGLNLRRGNLEVVLKKEERSSWTSSIVWYSREHDVSETGSVSVLR